MLVFITVNVELLRAEYSEVININSMNFSKTFSVTFFLPFALMNLFGRLYHIAFQLQHKGRLLFPVNCEVVISSKTLSSRYQCTYEYLCIFLVMWAFKRVSKCLE